MNDARASMLAICFAACASACGGAMAQVRPSGGGGADDGALASALGAPLAVGGEIRPGLHFDVPGSTAPPTRLLSARADVVEVRDGVLIGRSPGVSAVLVALTPSDTVLDILHVWVRPADRVEVHGVDVQGGDLGPLRDPLDLLPGESARLVAHPYAGGDRLVGVGTSTWDVDPPIASVLRDGMPNRVRLVARRPGNAIVRARMLGTKVELPVRVVVP